MDNKELLVVLESVKEMLADGINSESICLIESAHDMLWELEDYNYETEIGDIVDELKSCYKNNDFDCAEEASNDLKRLILDIKES